MNGIFLFHHIIELVIASVYEDVLKIYLHLVNGLYPKWFPWF